MAEVLFTPVCEMVVDKFENSPGLSRIAFLEGNGPMMIGKVVFTKKSEN
jgi:hypothetical protein